MAMGFREEEEAKLNKRNKFSNNDTVEVRSEEEGFQGSWHPGTVFQCQNYGWGARYFVQYSHMFAEGGSDNLVDFVDVPDLGDENNCSMVKLCNRRGRIRPSPHLLKFEKRDLSYGVCVDVYYNDSWWEGVIFDHDYGSNKRQIFFPDLGDEMMTCIDAIRISQDWNNLTGTWKTRGTWLFLEVIEQFEGEYYLPVSVKQLWYDIREKNNSQEPVEWVSTGKDIWKSLVSEAVDGSLKIVTDHFFQELDLPEDAQALLESGKPFNDVNAYPEAVFGQNHDMVSVENMSHSNMSYPNSSSIDSIQERSSVQQFASLLLDNRSHMHLLTDSNVPCHEKGECLLPQGWGLPSNRDGISVTNSTTNEKDFSRSNAKKNNERYSSLMCSKSSWLPAGPDLVPGAEFCPDAVLKYACMGKKRPPYSMLVDIRKHLLHLSWKIEYWKQGNVIKLRYISPNGDCHYSLYKVCLYLTKRHPDILSSTCHEDDTGLFNSPGNLSSLLIEQSPENQDSLVSSHSNVVALEPEYCPEAAIDWFKFGFEERFGTKNTKGDIRRMTLRAKKHLLAVGWHFKYVNHCGRLELRYNSPSGRAYNSLRMACKDAVAEGASGGHASTSTRLERKTISNIVKGQSPRENLSSSWRKTELQKLENVPLKFKLGWTRKIENKRKERVNLSFCLNQQEANLDGHNFLPKMGKEKTNSGLFKLKNGRTSTSPTCLLRSHKRVLEVVVPNPWQQKPRTILSWLIDNKVLLPREKVYYCSRKGGHPIAEGRITRDGIKCKCCGKVYTLSSFELHVSGKNERPAASIFLEDRRSLLDCQMQIVHDEMGNFAVDSPERLNESCHQGENDNICSVCHYGGELILCDQCPSSFHKSCLGLKDIPDGDWFCPSCCCKICGQNKLKRETLHSLDDNCILTCTQCEHKYHAGCLRIKGEDNIKRFPKENWFCSKKCEVIFLGLHELVGKSIPVGLNNLSWTLLKSIQSDSCKLDAPDIHALTENYSKLCIALEVMHECFEPVQEPRTKRDLVKDVIFSKESKLNRLNFRGFYTVLLEKDDELITVATVRVYGEKVAEIPLVGTRFQYRRLGMCHILMDMLEKKLMELGVERLVLPAVPSVLHAWTVSFGFSKMTHSERLQFLDHTFLDFQDTIMCRKLLMKIPSVESSPSTEVPGRLQNNVRGSDDTINRDGSSAVSDLFQADETEGGIVEQGQVEVAASNSSSGREWPIQQVFTVNTTDSHGEPDAVKVSKESEDSIFKKEIKDIDNGSNTCKVGRRYDINMDLKCYRRRKLFSSRN